MKTRLGLLVLLWCSLSPMASAQFMIPNENLLADGIPNIPASIADVVGNYTNFRTASFQDWHPTRQEMLILTRFADTTQVHQVSMPGGARTQLTFSRESVSSASYDPVAGKFIVFSRGAGGNERFQLYRLDLASGTTTLLTDGKSRNSAGRWSRKGDRIAYTSTRRNGADTDICILNPTDPKSDQLVKEMAGGGWQVSDWAPGDGSLLLEQYISINESVLYRLDLATRDLKRLTPESGKEPVAYANGHFSKDGKRLFLTTDRDSEFQQLAILDLETNKISPLGKPVEGDIESFHVSPDERMIAYTVNMGGVGVLSVLDVAQEIARQFKTLPAGSLSRPRWHPRENSLAFGAVSASSPGDVYSFNQDTGKVSRWTQSETGGLVTRDFAEPRLVRWKSFDEHSISGFLYMPPTRFQGKRPVVIDIHGGPESQFRPGYLGRKNYYLQEMGVALLFPNVRGSAGLGKTFLKLDNGLLREGSYRDIGALFDWIAAQPDLDASRVMVTGGSYGGFMTLAVACNYADRIRCAVDIVGISHFATFLKNTESYRRDLRRVEYGDEREPAMLSFMNRIAPLNNVDKMTKPMFIIQGKNDPRVPVTEAEQMVAALKKQGIPVWYLLGKDEGHGFAKKANADYQFFATVRFMEEYLLK